MKIPNNADIPIEKLTRYLLVFKARNDKSKYLAKGGFSQENPDQLLKAIRSLTETIEAVPDRASEYGTFYHVEGELTGAHGSNILVVTVWLQWKTDDKFHFVTLIPAKEKQS